MARKNSLVFPILTAHSLAASFNSAATIVRNLDNCSYQINVTTSNSTGSFSVQASDDYAVNADTNVITNAGTWVDLPLGGTPAVAAANDSIMVDLNQLPFNAIRIAYTAGTPGTGTCNAVLIARQLAG